MLARGAKDTNIAGVIELQPGVWLITGSATLQAEDDGALADCQITVDVNGESQSYPFVRTSMGRGGDIDSFTGSVLVTVESERSASAASTCTGEKGGAKILSLTIWATEADGGK